MKSYSEKNMSDWSAKYKAPMTENYQPSKSEFAGEQGKTLDYMTRQDRIQNKMASQVRNQKYHGKYE